MTEDLYIPRDCKLIVHQFGLGSGFKIQGSEVNHFALFPLTIDSIGLIPRGFNLWTSEPLSAVLVAEWTF